MPNMPLPPTMSAAPSNVGGSSVPQGNQGNVVQAMSLVRNGLEMFQKAIALVPMGSPLHEALLKSISGVSKHMEANQGNKGVDLQSLLQMAKQASQQSPIQALNRMTPPAPTAAPAMPVPSAAA